MAKAPVKIPVKVDGFPGIDILDRDHVRLIVDGDPEVFSRHHRYCGHPLSGLAEFGPVIGDWRPIQNIADDVHEVFRLLDLYIQRQESI